MEIWNHVGWHSSHLGSTSGRGGWIFLPSSPLSKFDEQLEEPLCASPPLPFAEECLLDCLFKGVYHLVPWEVDGRESPFCVLHGLAMLKFTLSIIIASLLGLEGGTIT
jgi:hypothetical protein